MRNDRNELQVSEKKPVEKSVGEPIQEGLMYIPQVDIIEDQDAIILRADVPGVRNEQLDIDLRDGILTLQATVQPPPQNWRPLYSEYEVGGFARRFTVGDRIAQDKISAKLEGGVLTLTLPKAEAHKPRRIEVR